jgi:hypothetical protein
MVESNDRLLLGWIADLDHTGGADALRMRSRDRPTTLLVPLELVETIDADGTARLRCSRQELDGLTSRVKQEAPGVRAPSAMPKPADPRPLVPDIDYVPIGVVVQNRQAPRQEGDRFIVPIYEEQLVVDKRLVLRAEVRIRVGQSAGESPSPVAESSPPVALPPDLPTLPAKRHLERAQAVPTRRALQEAGDGTEEPGSSWLQRWLLRLLR